MTAKRTIIFRNAVLALTAAVIFLPACRKETGSPPALEASGIVEAVTTEVRAQAQGEIKKILVEEGQAVKAGDLLCVVDDEKLALQLGQIEAGIQASEARVRLARRGAKKELIAMAQSQVDVTAKQLELARKDQERLAKLLAQGAVSEIQKEKADLGLKAAQEQHRSARENFDMVSRGLEREEIEMAEAELQSLRSQKQLLERTRRDFEVRAPVDGVVEVKHVEPGELAIPGAALFTLIDPKRPYVKAYIPEADLGRIKLGTPVEVVCDSFPGRAFRGKIDYISSEAEFAPKNIQTKEERLKLVFMIKAYLDNPDGVLKPGLPVDVKVLYQ
jgi:HlyD family secretion protein